MSGTAAVLAADYVLMPDFGKEKPRERVVDSMRTLMKWMKALPAEQANEIGDLLADGMQRIKH